MHASVLRPPGPQALGLPPPSTAAATASSSSAEPEGDVSTTAEHQSQSPFHLALGALNSLPKALLGWPLDTSKTLLQTTPAARYPPPLRTLRVLQTTVREHGLRGLYKGVGGPAAGWACIDAGVLGGLWKARGWLHARGWREAHGADERLTIGGHLLAGTLAGLMVVPIAHPIDLVKNKVQYALRLPAGAPDPTPSAALTTHPRTSGAPSSRPQRLSYPNPRYFQHQRPPPSACAPASPALLGFFTPSSSTAAHASSLQPCPAGAAGAAGSSRFLSSLPRPAATAAAAPSAPLGPFATLAAVYAEGGLVRGVYHGLPWTALCRGGMGVMFGTYEVLLRAQARVWPAAGEGGVGRVGQTFVAGALSSVVFWTVFLPADNVKAVLLTDASNPAARKFHSARAAIAHIYALSAPAASPSSSAASAPLSLAARAKARLRRLRPFWRGGGAVVVRASAVNGLGLVLWEGAMRAVGERTLS